MIFATFHVQQETKAHCGNGKLLEPRAISIQVDGIMIWTAKRVSLCENFWKNFFVVVEQIVYGNQTPRRQEWESLFTRRRSSKGWRQFMNIIFLQLAFRRECYILLKNSWISTDVFKLLITLFPRKNESKTWRKNRIWTRNKWYEEAAPIRVTERMVTFNCHKLKFRSDFSIYSWGMSALTKKYCLTACKMSAWYHVSQLGRLSLYLSFYCFLFFGR